MKDLLAEFIVLYDKYFPSVIIGSLILGILIGILGLILLIASSITTHILGYKDLEEASFWILMLRGIPLTFLGLLVILPLVFAGKAKSYLGIEEEEEEEEEEDVEDLYQW